MANGDDTENEELPPLSSDDFLFYKSKYIEVLNGMRGRINTGATAQQITDLRTDLETRITDVRNELITALNGHNGRINDLVEAVNRAVGRVNEIYDKCWDYTTGVQRYANGLQEQINELNRRISRLE